MYTYTTPEYTPLYTAVETTPRTATKANAVEQGRWDKPENQDKSAVLRSIPLS